MLEVLKEIGNATVWAFWTPVVVWTGLAGVAVLVLRRARCLHPTAGYRLRQAVLLALPVSILAAQWLPAVWGPVIWTPSVSTTAVLTPTSVAPALGSLPSMLPAGLAPSIVPSQSGAVEAASLSAPGVDIVAILLGSATVAFVLLAVARLATVTADIRQLRRLRRLAPPVDDPASRRMLRELAERLGVRRPVALLEGPPDSAPLTFGAWRPAVVVPRALLGSPGSLRAALAHELIHIRRADYLWALLDSLTAAVFAFHPLVWLLKRGIERCRETSCDADVLARGFVRPKPYAELLAHTHTPAQFPMPAVAASLSAPSLKLKERLDTMKNFAHKRLTSRQRLGIVLGAGLVCMVIAAAAACAIRTEEEPPALLEPSHALEELSELEMQRHQELSELEIEEHQDAFHRSYQPRGPYFTITRGSGSSRYIYRATEEDVLEVLARLDLEMEYLRQQMNETDDGLREIDSREVELMRKGGEYFRDNPAEVIALRRDRDHLRDRLELLKTMRTERMRESETVKLEYETQKRMPGGLPSVAAPLGGPVF